MARHLVLRLNLDIYVDIWVHAAHRLHERKVYQVSVFTSAKAFRRFSRHLYKSPCCSKSHRSTRKYKILRPAEVNEAVRSAEGEGDGTDGCARDGGWTSSTLTHNRPRPRRRCQATVKQRTAVSRGTGQSGATTNTRTENMNKHVLSKGEVCRLNSCALSAFASICNAERWDYPPLLT